MRLLTPDSCWQVETYKDILNAQKLLFPGVGSYGQAMGALQERGLVEALKEFLQVQSAFTALFAFSYLQANSGARMLRRVRVSHGCWPARRGASTFMSTASASQPHVQALRTLPRLSHAPTACTMPRRTHRHRFAAVQAQCLAASHNRAAHT